MAMLFYKQWKAKAWLEALRAADPGLDIRVHPELGDVRDIVFALAWAPPAGLLKSLPNLKAVQSFGAGVEHLFADPELPAGLPIARLVDEQLIRGMVEYVVLHVLRQHRKLDRTLENHRERRWERRTLTNAATTTVGVMGLGTLGSAVGRALASLGFRVIGWSRTQKDLVGIEAFSGAQGLDAFVRRCNHLVCLLPLTPATHGIVDATLLAKLPPGAYFINAGRGAQVVDADLLAALEGGPLAGATLDVFTTEPLPPEHPFWAHPRILVTSHNSGETDPMGAAPQVAENYRRVHAGQPMRNVIDREQGY